MFTTYVPSTVSLPYGLRSYVLDTSGRNLTDETYTQRKCSVSSRQECKLRWTSLIRNQYRRHLKRCTTKNGQEAVSITKWRYADEISFVKPYIRERDTMGNLEDGSIVGPGNTQREDIPGATDQEQCENPCPTRHEVDSSKSCMKSKAKVRSLSSKHVSSPGTGNTQREDIPGATDQEQCENPCPTRHEVDSLKSCMKSKAKVRSLSSKHVSSPETASSFLIKYLVENNSDKQEKSTDSMDLFFQSMTATVKTFTPYYKNICKTQVLSVVSDLEMKQLRTRVPFNTGTQTKNQASTPSPGNTSSTCSSDAQDYIM
ncbi:uncharacterized protein LOC143021093 [Oratosquilla oratoria]|uniref:uncharacterized protein LOC143021093 n=1 Tax=Oratosquilla oratoria TaxID=337810 RepID=UPI003F76237D